MTIVASDSTQTRSAASMLLRYQVARAVLAGAIGAVGVVALSAAGLALFFGLVPASPAAVSSQLPDEPGIIAEPPALAGSNLTALSRSDRDAKQSVVEPTSGRAVPIQEATATPASPVPPREPLAGTVSPSADLLSTTPIGPQPVPFVPAASVQERNTSVELADPETVSTRAVVNKPQAAVADKKTANPVAERVGAVASIRKAALIRPVQTTPVTRPRGTEAIQARSGQKAEATPSREPQRDKVPRKAMVGKAATAVSMAEATASPGPAAPAPAETEQLEGTEVFGLRVPSLAPAGRKIQESIEALGGAIKSLPDRF